jgi:hypothetical protein
MTYGGFYLAHKGEKEEGGCLRGPVIFLIGFMVGCFLTSVFFRGALQRMEERQKANRFKQETFISQN